MENVLYKCGGCDHNTGVPKKLIMKSDPCGVTGVSQVKSLVGLSQEQQKHAIYSAHAAQSAGYKTVKVYSAYMGEVDLNVYDVGNGYISLQALVPGLDGRPDIFVKEVDVQKHDLYPDKYQYDIRYLAQVQSTFINIQKASDNAKTIELIEAKKKMKELSGIKLNSLDQKRLHAAYIYNNAVDIHFNTCQYLHFLHKYTGKNNVTNSNILLSMHNVVSLDNAFWTGNYMVYGNGNKTFYPLGTSDIGGHEAGHGLIQTVAGLKYQGHSGALNESFADVLGVCFEFFLYYKFNNNKDGNTDDDIDGESDWLIGEDSGKQIEYLRNMKDPNNAKQPQPKIYRGMYWVNPNNKDSDFGGVHTNSGVGNYTFYLLSTHLGWEKALGVFWECLQQLGPDSSYIDFRDYLKAVAAKDTVLTNAVKRALYGSGLTDTAVTDWNV
jgi:Zn-dependent metalloprotease